MQDLFLLKDIFCCCFLKTISAVVVIGTLVVEPHFLGVFFFLFVCFVFFFFFFFLLVIKINKNHFLSRPPCPSHLKS